METLTQCKPSRNRIPLESANAEGIPCPTRPASAARSKSLLMYCAVYVRAAYLLSRLCAGPVICWAAYVLGPLIYEPLNVPGGLYTEPLMC